MRKLFFLIFLFCSHFSFSHEFFFSFAEVEYNEMNGRIEVSLTATTHDLDKHLRALDKDFKGLDKVSSDSTGLNFVEKELNRCLVFAIPQENSTLDGFGVIYFHLDGIETALNGTVAIYLSAEYRSPLSKLEVTFDLLMDDLPDQQNKLTFIYRGKKSTFVFLPNQRTQLIDLTHP
jgi:hypothetical protein